MPENRILSFDTRKSSIHRFEMPIRIQLYSTVSTYPYALDLEKSLSYPDNRACHSAEVTNNDASFSFLRSSCNVSVDQSSMSILSHALQPISPSEYAEATVSRSLKYSTLYESQTDRFSIPPHPQSFYSHTDKQCSFYLLQQNSASFELRFEVHLTGLKFLSCLPSEVNIPFYSL